MATELSTTVIVELLSQLLARRTAPGQGHVILSAAEYDERLKRELEETIAPGSSIQESTLRALRAVRNELVHGTFAVEVEEAGAPGGEERDLRRWTQALIEAEVIVPLDAGTVLEALKRIGRLSDDGDLVAPAAIADAFLEQLTAESDLLGKLDTDEAARLGRHAATQVVASARWSQIVGDRLDTTQVAQLLGVTRQALAKRQNTGSLLGLAGDGTTWYPTWQFDTDAARIRPEVRDVIGAFRDRLDDGDPLGIAAWATTPQDEDLAGETPAQWLLAGRDPDQLRRAAERAAAHLAG